MAGAVWVGDPTHRRQMKNISIGGVYHSLVYGADTPGPIWKDAMTGALEGKPVENFNLVDIPDGDKGRGHGHDDGDNGDPGDDGFIGGLVGGNNGGEDNGGNGNGGNGNGGTFPTPTFSIPENLFEGQNGNGGNGPGGGAADAGVRTRTNGPCATGFGGSGAVRTTAMRTTTAVRATAVRMRGF